MSHTSVDKKDACNICGEDCDCVRYIGRHFDAANYNKYLHIPKDIKSKIADYLLTQLGVDSGKKKEIFTAGVGPGRIEIPFLNKCLAKNIPIKLTAVDLDTGMLREFYENIKEEFNKKTNIKEIGKKETSEAFNGKRGIHYFHLSIDRVEIEAFCGNLENLHKKSYFKKCHYDYIFSIFVLHAITNWEEPLYNLLRMLKPGGKIVFAEEIGDVNWLDNHFDDIEKYGLCTEAEIKKSILGSDYT